MVYVRGNPLDYDTWSQFGNRGWSYDAVPLGVLLVSKPARRIVLFF